MPRIPPSTLINAYRENPLLPLLLKECRTLESSRNELRWLREHALRSTQTRQRVQVAATSPTPLWKTHLTSLCRQRSRGYPLQYILGDQPFGDLEILCRPGVLIPRPDTESYVYQAAKLVNRIVPASMNQGRDQNQTQNQNHGQDQDQEQSHQHNKDPKTLRILDLCTGTGCITLLLHALLAPRFKQLRVMGIDISPKALSLARRNLDHNLKQGLLSHRASNEIQFHRADVLDGSTSINTNIDANANVDTQIPNVEKILSEYFDFDFDQFKSPLKEYGSQLDLLISNPPYISTSDFRNGTTARSVRLFEPKLALVPPSPTQSPHSPHSGGRGGTTSSGDIRPEDIFYHRILELSNQLRTRITVLECGDIEQAERVIEMHERMMALKHDFDSDSDSDCFKVQVWPNTEQDMAFYGFHANEGSRCVIIERG